MRWGGEQHQVADLSVDSDGCLQDGFAFNVRGFGILRINRSDLLRQQARGDAFADAYLVEQGGRASAGGVSAGSDGLNGPVAST